MLPYVGAHIWNNNIEPSFRKCSMEPTFLDIAVARAYLFQNTMEPSFLGIIMWGPPLEITEFINARGCDKL